jgi:small-conductance mechanosensitive channel
MDPLTAAALKRLAVWWIANRPFSKEKREARQERRRRRREGLPPLEEIQMDKQLLQGALTYVGIAISGVSFVLDHFGIVVTGYDSATVAGVVVGLALAVYGRIRRELRPDGT